MLVMKTRRVACRETYKKPTNVLSVDIEDLLKAEHCVEPARDMQF